jgi:hypothetical protein
VLHVRVDPSYPGAWRKSPYFEQLKDRSNRMAVQITVGRRRYIVLPDGEAEVGDSVAA